MFNSIANPNNRLQKLLILMGLVGLFIVGFQVSAIIFASASELTDAPVTSNPSPGGVALVDPPHRLRDFTLTSKSGEPIQLSDLRGHVVLLFFGYTHCPDVCPTTLSDYKQVKRMLGDQAEQVAFVFVSVDGRRDTPEQMTAFLDQFDPNFVGMTGDEATLRDMGAEYGLVFSAEQVSLAQNHNEHDAHQERAAEGQDTLDVENYFVQHTSPTFVIDRNGVLRMVDFYRTKPETMAAGVRQLLQEAAR